MEFFFGNLPFSTTEVELKALVERTAQVRVAEARLIYIDQAKTSSKGCGFVNVIIDRTEAETASAVLALHGTEYEGRILRAEPSRRERERRARLQRGAA